MMEFLTIPGGASLAFVPGAIGLTCQLAWPLMRSRPAILAVQSGIGLGYGAQYALLDAWSGAALCWIGAGQTLLLLIAGAGRLQKVTALAVFPLLALAILLTWSGPASACAAIACALTMIGRQQSDTLRLRQLQLLAAPFGMTFDILTGALPALCGGIIATTIAALALRREVAARHAAIAA